MSTMAWQGSGSQVATQPRRRAAQPRRRAARAGSVRMRLTRRGRAVVLALAVALAFAVGAIAGQAQAASGESDLVTETVVVAPGQTLWEIADGVAGDEDVRDVIALIERINELDSSALAVGQVLQVPALD